MQAGLAPDAICPWTTTCELDLSSIRERNEGGKSLAVFPTIRRLLARDDVVQRAHWKSLHIDVARERLGEAHDAVRRKYQVQVERAVSEQNVSGSAGRGLFAEHGRGEVP